MTILDGRAAVQERLDALDAERAILVQLLDGYDSLAAIQQPGRPVVAATAPVPMPEADDSPPAVVPPAPRRHKKETFVCSRCPQTFKTRGWRDRHESKQPPIPSVGSSGGERIRRTPPVNGYRVPSA